MVKIFFLFNCYPNKIKVMLENCFNSYYYMLHFYINVRVVITIGVTFVLFGVNAYFQISITRDQYRSREKTKREKRGGSIRGMRKGERRTWADRSYIRRVAESY